MGDTSLQSVKVSIWGDSAEEVDLSDNPIIVCKGARVNDFNGRSLSIGGNTVMKLNPDTLDTQRLKRWFQETGKLATFSYFQSSNQSNENFNIATEALPKITIQKAKDDGLGTNGRADYFCVRATIVFIKADNPAYPACPQCKKKVMLTNDNKWSCENCQKHYPKPDYRYILTAKLEDETSQLFISGFDDFGKALLKMDANDYMQLMEENPSSASHLVQNASYRVYNFKIKAREELYNVIFFT